jgi:hypothetical protein
LSNLLAHRFRRWAGTVTAERSRNDLITKVDRGILPFAISLIRVAGVSGQDHLLPHRIRLRGPWDCDPQRQCFTRRFHQPTGLTAETQVWLVIDQASAAARIELNGTTLGQAHVGQAIRWEITADMKPHNLLAITFTDPPPVTTNPTDDLIGQVSLEIEEPSA